MYPLNLRSPFSSKIYVNSTKGRAAIGLNTVNKRGNFGTCSIGENTGIVKFYSNDISMHLKHIEKYETRKLYLNSLQSLLMTFAILASERKDDELQTLFYKDLNDLSTDFPSEYIECFLQKQYNSKLYPELLKIVLPEFYLTDYYGMFLVAIIDVGCSSVALNLLPNYKSNIRSTDQLLCLDAMSAFASNDHLIEAC
ncbi:unnamed protein product [Rotaria sp. Silwood2]|nr:unnamed protein product [Rotaria sp. Silwood2]CAF3982569.1 unnamed protein product [Rotaria sp. Silwood2]CAF4171661.1 unnamed protein product [Rotaria sp. Silwood2]